MTHDIDYGTIGYELRNPSPLLADASRSSEGTTELHRRWDSVQASFVDDPRAAVSAAGLLVKDAADRLLDSIDALREIYECRWARGDDPSTEELRVAMQRFRTLFESLAGASPDGSINANPR